MNFDHLGKIGITSFGHKHRIITEVKKLKQGKKTFLNIQKNKIDKQLSNKHLIFLILIIKPIYVTKYLFLCNIDPSGQCDRLQVTGISGRYDGLNGVYEGTDLQSLDRKVWKHVDTEL